MSIEELEDIKEESSLPAFFPAWARLSLAIRAPGPQRLCFTNLPSLISEGPSADGNLIGNMITCDISAPAVVMVLIALLAMDIAHQNTFSLLKSVDPDSKRTIGVLIMPACRTACLLVPNANGPR